jgi:UDP-N-acetylglucosamine diphosphorylase/glucosamine-1-phosphate N-acetyltransferase
VEKHDRFAAIILAAGQGKRMQSDLAKVLHAARGSSLVEHVLAAVRGAGVQRIVVVVGHQAQRVEEHLAQAGVQFALQAEQLGTGHAVQQAQAALADWQDEIVVLCGDTPLLTSETLRALFDTHRDTQAAATVLTAELDDPTGYGRVVRGPDDSVLRIVEQKDATPEELRVREINSGLYVFSSADLWQALTKVDADNAQREYYLTDTLEILRSEGRRVSAYRCQDPREVLGVNNPDQLREAEAVLAQRVGSA